MQENFSTFEGIILAIMAAGLIFLFARNTKSAMENTPKAKKGDWLSAILPIAAVIGFVFILVMLAKK